MANSIMTQAEVLEEICKPMARAFNEALAEMARDAEAQWYEDRLAGREPKVWREHLLGVAVELRPDNG